MWLLSAMSYDKSFLHDRSCSITSNALMKSTKRAQENLFSFMLQGHLFAKLMSAVLHDHFRLKPDWFNYEEDHTYQGDDKYVCWYAFLKVLIT